MPATIRFLGAARTVTGSRFLVETNKAKVLVDCGMFQGRKELRLRNWEDFPVDPSGIDSLIVSHAHLDHIGYVPAVVKQGFSGSIYATHSTIGLGEIVLRDSARIQEADAEYANRKGFSKHDPALPLYTEHDAEEAISRFVEATLEKRFEVAEGIQATLHNAGHILGSASILLEFDDGTPSVYFSGDLGRPLHPVMLPPSPPLSANVVVCESTYGDEEHIEEDGTAELGKVIAKTVDRGGSVVIPAFAVDRTEIILHSLRRLVQAGEIPNLPVYLDSPMARAALGFYLKAVADGHPEIRPEVAGHPEVFDPGNLTITESVDDSKAINDVREPKIVVSASGMATGGRVLHHLVRELPKSSSTVILVGYQAVGTRGSRLLDGEKTLKIHGEDIPVRATIASVPAFSVHADRSELLDWIASAPTNPDRLLAVHGDEEAALSFVDAVRERYGWDATAPEDDSVVEI